MALIQCPECKHDVSDSALACPACGCRLKDSASDGLAREVRSIIRLLNAAVWTLVVIFVIYFISVILFMR